MSWRIAFIPQAPFFCFLNDTAAAADDFAVLQFQPITLKTAKPHQRYSDLRVESMTGAVQCVRATGGDQRDQFARQAWQSDVTGFVGDRPDRLYPGIRCRRFALQAPLLGPGHSGSWRLSWSSLASAKRCGSGTQCWSRSGRFEPAHYATMNGVNGSAGLALGVVLLLASGPLASASRAAACVRRKGDGDSSAALAGIGCAPTRRPGGRWSSSPLAIRMISGSLRAVSWVSRSPCSVPRLGARLAAITAAVHWRLRCWGQLAACLPGEAVPIPLARSVRVRLALLVSRIMTWLSSQLPRFILALHLTVAELACSPWRRV